MYVNDDIPFLFISMPRCATQALHTLLHQHYRGEQIYLNEDCHTNIVPDRARGYFTWTVSRHPYSRAVSMYWYLLKHPYRKLILDTFDEFCDYILARVPKGRKGPLFPMWQQVEGIRIDKVLRFEYLLDDLDTLPFWTVRYKRWGGDAASHASRPASELLTARNVEILRQWAEKDFEMFGYSTDIPCI